MPPIAIQRWDHGEMGRVAASMLLDRMLRTHGLEPQRVVLPSTFVSNASIGPAKGAFTHEKDRYLLPSADADASTRDG